MALHSLQKLELDVLFYCHSDVCKSIENEREKNELQLVRSLASEILNGNYCEILASDLTTEIFCSSENIVDNFNEYMTIAIRRFLESDRFRCKDVGETVLMFIGVTALQQFIQNNWISISDGNSTTVEVLCKFFATDDSIHEWATKNLSSEELSVYKLARNLELLVFAKTVLCDCVSIPLTSCWWKFRCVKVCQSVLLEQSSLCYEKGKTLLPLMSNVVSACDDIIKNEADLYLNLEAFHFFFLFGSLTKAKEHLDCCQKLAGLEVELTGSLGKRTLYQQVPHAQLVLRVSRDSPNKEATLYDPNISDFPKDIALQDDTLLSSVKLLDINDEDVTHLNPIEQAILLSLCQQMQKMSANDELLQEETMAYLERILKQPQLWCIQLTSLFTRCKLEKHKARKIERAMTQLQVLVDASKSKIGNAWKRLHLFYCTSTPPWWVLEKELAHIMISLGAVKSALDVFLHLHLWEDVALCYQRLQEPEKATSILKQQLSIRETPSLWCLLGDVTADPKFYEKAWELSGGHSSRAQKSLGLWHFRKGDYTESIPFFQKSVELNSLDLEVWFPLAYSALETKDYDLAAKSYRHIVSLEPDSFEAWNNLSKVYILMKQKDRAWRTLQEALKCNYEEWRIWENYLLVSVDVGAFEDAIKSWHRLIEIKGKHLDEEILTIMITAVMTGVNDMNGQSASLLTDKALKLLGHITATDTNSARTWSLYGSLLNMKAETSESETDVMDRVVQYHQKAFRSATQKKDWEKEVETCRAAFDYGLKLVAAGVRLFHVSSDKGNSKRTLQSIRLMIKSAISIASRHSTVSPNDDLTALIHNLETKLNEFNDNISN